MCIRDIIWTIQKEDNQSMIWEFSGDDADIDITQMDEDQIIVAEWDGDDADIDIIQKSGTCPSGVTSCSGIVNIEVDSEGATLMGSEMCIRDRYITTRSCSGFSNRRHYRTDRG